MADSLTGIAQRLAWLAAGLCADSQLRQAAKVWPASCCMSGPVLHVYRPAACIWVFL